MSDEIVHNLDGCEISLVGDDLDPEREYLLLDGALLQQRGLELVNTSAYLTITGTSSPWSQLSSYASVTARQASLGEALDVRDVLVYLVTLRCNHLNSWILEVPWGLSLGRWLVLQHKVLGHGVSSHPGLCHSS